MCSAIPSLMRKDLLLMKHQKRSVISAALLLLMSPIFSSNPFFALFFCTFPFLIGVSILFSSGEKYGDARFMASLPVARAQIVIARYCDIILVGLLSLGIACGVNPLLARVQSRLAGPVLSAFARINITPVAATRYITPFTGLFVVTYLAFFSFYVGVMFPLCYKIGFAKGQILYIVILMVPGIAGMMLFGMETIGMGAPGATASVNAFFNAPVPALVMTAVVAACIGVLAASALLSVRIFQAKEL